RHVTVGMRMSDLARLLNNPSWLRAKDIFLFKSLTGYIPVRLDSKDTTFSVLILPEDEIATSAIYLRIGGKVDPEEFRSLLLGKAKSNTDIGNATIVEMAICEPSLVGDPRIPLIYHVP